jgi:hypothetical protein
MDDPLGVVPIVSYRIGACLTKYLISARVIGSQLPEKRREILFPLVAQMELLNQAEELNN